MKETKENIHDPERILREMIRYEHSKNQRNKIIHWVGNRQDRFDILANLLLQNEYRITQRAAWPISYIGIDHPNLIQPHLKRFIQNLQQPNLHQAVKRNTLRLLETINVPGELQGILMDCCFKFIEDPKETIAVKAHSLTILHQLSIQYPEILHEVKLLVSSQIEHFSPALKVRARPFFL